MKNITTLLFLLFSVLVFGQKPYTIPSLDSKKGITTLKFSPDPNQKKVISSYNEGVTARKPLKLKIKGTVMLQHVMVTVVSRDKNADIEVEILKKDWDDVKKSGKTVDGVYQESFETAGKFGIKIHGDRPGIPFYVVVWTTGEMIPAGKKLFYPSENYQHGKKVQVVYSNDGSDSNNNQSISNNNSNDAGGNSMMYLIIGILAIIAILLGIMVFKKKSASIIILFVLSQVSIQAGIHPSDGSGIAGIASDLKTMVGVVTSAKDFYDADRNSGYLSGEDDEGHRPNLDPAGQPQLPSSCYDDIPDEPEPEEPRNGRDGRDGRDGVNGQDGRNGENGSDGSDGVDGENGRDGEDGRDGENGSDTEDTDETKPSADRPKYNKDGKPIYYDDVDHPKYDKNGKPINYDDRDHPKYDKNGKPIEYGRENDDTDYDKNGRPKYNKDGKPIYYDDRDHPKYDKDGKPILYDDQDHPKYDKDGKPIKYGLVTDGKPIVLWASLAGNGRGNGAKKEGCECLKAAYETLHTKRYKLEKLKIIYNDVQDFTDKAVAFGDNVSGINALGGLAWQKERIGILKSMKTFYKAYDKKYKELIGDLEKVLKEIDKCENKMGFEAWYSKVGFIYYDFMKEKYKRN